MRSFSLLAFGLFSSSVTSLLVVACGGETTAVPSSQEQETRVKPDGSDLPASLRVVAPTGAPAEATVNVSRVSGKIGDVLGPLAEGDHVVQLNGGWLNSATTAKVTANQTTTIDAALLSIDLKAPPTLGLVPGVRLGRGTFPDYADLSPADDAEARIGSVTAEYTPSALFAGTYRLTYGLADGYEFDVAEGQKKSIDLAPSAGRRIAKLVAPTRELPNAECDTDRGAPRVEIKLADGSSLSADAPFADGSSLEIGAAKWHPDATYGVRTAGTNFFTPLPLGDSGKGPLVFELGRLDVDDVAVKQPDGSTKMVAGRYSVNAMTKDATGAWVEGVGVIWCGGAPAMPTNTGVDLPKGKYKLYVRYETTEAGSKVNEYTVDVK